MCKRLPRQISVLCFTFWAISLSHTTMSEKIEWCVAKLRSDFKWWVEKVSNDTHVDADYSGIIDPRQFEHIIELVAPLQDYGFRNDLLESAFLKFRIVAELANNQIKLEFTTSKALTSEEPLFLLPNVIADNEGPYAEFIDHIIRVRVKLLNDLIDFKVPVNNDEIEEAMREKYQEKYIEGNNVHVFDEIVDILEYTPAGYDIVDKEDFSGNNDNDDEEERYLDDGESYAAEDGQWDSDLDKLEILEQ